MNHGDALNLRITQIDIYRAALPFDAGRRHAAAPEREAGDAFNAASRQLTRMETLLVRVSTDEGAVGWGEAFGHLVNPVTFAALAGLVGRFFIGTHLSGDPASFAERLRDAHHAFHAFGRTGPVLYALSAIDTALWDLCAQGAGKPLHHLLGAQRDRIEVYASLVCYDNDPAEVATQVRRAHAAGFRKLKLHETTRAAIEAARAALPATVELMVDVNCPWSMPEAQSHVRSLQDSALAWIEEPVWPPDDIEGLARVRQLGVPIAAGENASGVEGFRQHFERGALDIAQPSVAKIGGVSGMLRVIALARAYDVRVVPHCFYYGAGLLATAHVVAALPDDVALELPWLQWPTPLHAAQNTGAALTLPETPGLGFAPDMGVLDRHLLDHATLN